MAYFALSKNYYGNRILKAYFVIRWNHGDDSEAAPRKYKFGDPDATGSFRRRQQQPSDQMDIYFERLVHVRNKDLTDQTFFIFRPLGVRRCSTATSKSGKLAPSNCWGIILSLLVIICGIFIFLHKFHLFLFSKYLLL